MITVCLLLTYDSEVRVHRTIHAPTCLCTPAFSMYEDLYSTETNMVLANYRLSFL